MTGGQTQRAGTFGSAGIRFQNFTGGAVGDFNMSLATAGSRTVTISAGDAIFVGFGGSGGDIGTVGIKTGSVVGATSGDEAMVPSLLRVVPRLLRSSVQLVHWVLLWKAWCSTSRTVRRYR